MVTTDQLRKLIEEKKVTIGTAATTKELRGDGLKRVLLASNIAPATKATLTRYQAMSKIDIEELPVPNDELGVMCKKPFSISVLGIKK